MNTIRNQNAERVFYGVFLIGLGLVAFFNIWWPGVLYALSGALIIRAVAEGKSWTDNQGALILLGIAVFFTFQNSLRLLDFNFWPFVLVGLGVYLLYGRNQPSNSNPDSSETKAKNDFV